MRGITGAELRNALRSLSRSPTVSIAAVLCLALGIGATTAISSALSRALLQPLPLRQPERLVSIWRTTPQSGPMGGWSQSPANYLELRERSTRLRDIAAVTWSSAIINLPDDAIQATLNLASGNLFQTAGASAQLGRLIQPDDDRLAAARVAVMSDEFWRTRFGADPTVVGRTLTINGEPTTVIGVLPADFRIPIGNNMFRPELWMPQRFTPEQAATRNSNYLQTFGRLADGATVAEAEAELRTIFSGIVETNPRLKGDNVRVAALHAESLNSVRKPLLLLFGAVIMVLLIAATNVAALLLARGVQKQREMAVRAALGASRWDGMRPVLLESAILTLVSLVIGVALGAAGVKTIGLLAASRIAHLDGLRMDGRVLALALALSAVVAIVCGAAPAWKSSRVDPQDALRGGRGGGTGRAHHRALRSLVTLEISLSLVLLIGAGLVLKGFSKLIANDPGFDTDPVLTLRITTSAARYPEGTAVRDFVEPSIAAIAALPQVEAVGAISAVPYSVWGNNSSTRYEGVDGSDRSRLPITEQRGVTPGFFGVTKQRLIAGRLLTAGDDERPESPPVVVVNEALVKRDFPGQNPIGKRFHRNDTTFATIVGVVSDIRNFGPIADPAPEMYWNYRQWWNNAPSVELMLRVKGDPASVTNAVRSAVRSVDPTAAVAGVRTMNELISRSLGSPRFYFSLLGTFAVVALVLAVAGLYGILSYAVEQRTREIGIRSALGSSSRRIVGLFVSEGLRLVIAGVALGLVGGMVVTRLMTFMLYGVSPLDASTWVLAALVMIAAAMLAALVPSLRASRVDPLVAIQNE